MNALIKWRHAKAAGFMACDVEAVDELLKILEETSVTAKAFTVGKMNLEDLPEETQAQVKNILRAYNEVNVTYEHGEFRVMTGHCICARYASDHFVCGDYRADEVYTKEERRQNFIEEFGYAPAFI